MTRINKFEDIVSWQKARILAKEVYAATKGEAFSRDHALKTQIRRAAISAASNIAEGFERDGNKEFVHFLSIAKASACEVRSHLYIAFDQNYISKEDFIRLSELTSATGRIIGGFIKYLRSNEKKGSKFKVESCGFVVNQKPGTRNQKLNK